MEFKKKKTTFGRFLYKHKIEEEWLVKKTGIGKKIIDDLISNPNKYPSRNNKRKILKALYKFNPLIKSNDFWN
ncbi:XRE family transcriptional regulator [Bacillus cereus group sp. MYBK234-1]|uniref:XRE family transcriptional regulator n=1 Tax=unclassified Bacillus cereus group TaxID=2750818 RepID=UPI003F79C59B